LNQSEYYDEAYFTPKNQGGKADFGLPYDWEHEGGERVWRTSLFRRLYNPQRVLEVGCATGLLIQAFAKMGIEAYGCDISRWAIENCTEGAKDRVKLVDITKGLPYDDNSFDLICSMGTLEHIEMKYLDFIASEFARVTSGWVHLGQPIGSSNENKPWGDPDHKTFMPASWWITLFYKYGLLVDLRKTWEVSLHPCHNIELSLCKGVLPDA